MKAKIQYFSLILLNLQLLCGLIKTMSKCSKLNLFMSIQIRMTYDEGKRTEKNEN